MPSLARGGELIGYGEELVEEVLIEEVEGLGAAEEQHLTEDLRTMLRSYLGAGRTALDSKLLAEI